jgi:low affinity Fe/Cu permease
MSVLLKDAEAWVRQLSTATAVSGAGAVVTMVFVIVVGRQRWGRQMKKQKDELEEMTRAFEKTMAELTLQKRERKRVEEDLKKTHIEIDSRVDERTAQLNKAYPTAKRAEGSSVGRTRHGSSGQGSRTIEGRFGASRPGANAGLQKLQRRFESILNSAGEGIYGLDLQEK